jgi:predicted O-linked N-acetylglucosamine transferase (SPINDLY family)
MGADKVIHYLISDRHVSPPEHVADYSERLVFMPHCYQVNYYEYKDMEPIKKVGERIMNGEAKLWDNNIFLSTFLRMDNIQEMTQAGNNASRATKRAWELQNNNNDSERFSAANSSCHEDNNGFRSDFFVFANFNKNDKIEPVVYDVWMNLLRQYPNSILWLLDPSANAAAGTIRDNLVREAEARGILGSRLVFAPRVSKQKHLQRHESADLFIDTFWYNAHSTGTDALKGGLPVLTCVGRSFPSRVASSLLNTAMPRGNVELPEEKLNPNKQTRHPLITHSLKEFENVGLKLALDIHVLRALRQKLSLVRADRKSTVPLFDTSAYTAALERAFFMMWELFVSYLPAENRKTKALTGFMHIVVPEAGVKS